MGAFYRPPNWPGRLWRTDIADIVILHSADKEGAARRLGDAVAAEGYSVTAVEIEKPDRLADTVEGCVADARILIWSKPLVFHLLHSGELPRIRQLSGLIEVSADGIAPPSRGDEARTILISGWRGQPFHPGWQRIHLELKRLCGNGKSAGGASRPPVEPRNARPPTAAPHVPRGGARASTRLMLGGAVAFLLVGAAVGAANWFGASSPDDQPREVSGPRQAGPTGKALPPVPDAAPVASKVVESAGPASDAGSSLPAQEEKPAKAGQELPRAAPASVRPEGAGDRRPGPRSRAERPKKYSPKHSKVMRQFCERSGRSTPQCRSFLRSVRAP